MRDYSQTGEQAAIFEALGIAADPLVSRFLDIGAWHAEDKSNTRALWEIGWRGIFVEPSPGPLKGLVKEYGMQDRAIVIGAAMTISGGLVELLVTDDAVTCAPGSEGAKIWDKDGGFYGKVLSPSLSVADFLTRFGGDFDMLSIDTEGTSVDLLIEFLRLGPRPRCIVVEHNDRFVELAGYMQAATYRQLLLNGNNAVFQWQCGL